MKKYKLVIPLMGLLILCLAISSASAASHNINETSYSDYFNNDGSFKDSVINDGDELVIDGDINNRDFQISKNVTIDGKNNGKIVNGTIKINGGADSRGSTVKNVYIYNVDKNAIEITNGASFITLSNLNINILGTVNHPGGSYASLYGILAQGETSNINLFDNIISINGVVPYNYGISVSCYDSSWQTKPNPNNYIISGNKIISNITNNYIAGIYTDSPVNFTIRDNRLDLMSNNLIYGIAITDMFLSDMDNLIPARGINILNNTVYGKGNCIFLIELFQVGIWEIMDDYGEFNPILIENNTLLGKGTSVYGIAIGSSQNITIDGNNITTLGGDYKLITKTNDSAAPIGGIAPINLHGSMFGQCKNLNITNNHFETNNGVTVGNTNSSVVPMNITYLNNLQDFVVDDDSYSNFFDDEGIFLDNLNITSNSTLKLGNLTRKKLVIDRELNLISYGSNSILNCTQITLTSGASGSLIDGLYFDSNDSVIILQDSSSNILKNIVIIIKSNIDDVYPNNIVTGINLKGSSSKNQILNNKIYINGTKNPTYGAYFYGIQVGDYPFVKLDSNNITENEIFVNGGTISYGIVLNSVKDTIINNNNISAIGRDFAYVLIVQDWSSATVPSINNQIINNKIYGKASMVYLIESINSQGTIIKKNTLLGDGNAVYGYASHASKNDVIEGNNIEINGTDLTNTPANYDIINSGHAGIFGNNSQYMMIINNKIVSNYKKGGDYAIRIINSPNESINILLNNYLSSDNKKKLGKEAISAFKSDLINNNTPKGTSITIKTNNITKGKSATITAILKDEDGKVIKNGKISLKIAGKTYYKNTNSEGVATFKISSLGIGKHSIQAIYGANKDYASVSKVGTQVVKGIADLKITKIVKNGNYYKLAVKNQGSAKTTNTKLKIWYKQGNKIKSKIVNVKSIGAGKSIIVNVKFFKYSTHKKYVKYVKVNYNKVVSESNYKNNLKKFRV
ncbi:Ig-like domain-containing protein [Methanobrevibacter arboriphilus]|uniref:Ig-like domain-containing protein n=1 Tax=Methanobrevibacter arboriphilus TaxID=39441 RepID=UPI0005B252EF|nr:Ig-like domain-containing protein [Methanobrevibacter arboriphilus]